MFWGWKHEVKVVDCPGLVCPSLVGLELQVRSSQTEESKADYRRLLLAVRTATYNRYIVLIGFQSCLSLRSPPSPPASTILPRSFPLRRSLMSLNLLHCKMTTQTSELGGILLVRKPRRRKRRKKRSGPPVGSWKLEPLIEATVSDSG